MTRVVSPLGLTWFVLFLFFGECGAMAQVVTTPEVEPIPRPGIQTPSRPGTQTLSLPRIEPIASPDAKSATSPDVKPIVSPRIEPIASPEAEPVSTRPPDEPPRRQVQIGVLIRESLGTCLEAWSPMADYLSDELPAYHFTVVPLASRDDVFQTISDEATPFLILDPEIHVEAERRFETSCLATMVGQRGETTSTDHSGVLVRRAADSSLRTVDDLRGRVLAAPRGTGFSSWGMQRLALFEHGLDIDRDLKKVIFTGSQQAVLDAVLDGTADVGAVDADWLAVALENGDVPSPRLHAFGRDGTSVPLGDPIPVFTRAFPEWAFATLASTNHQLAEQVAKAVLKYRPKTVHAESGHFAGWTVPRSYESVRREVALLKERQDQAKASKDLFTRATQGDPAALRALGLIVFSAAAFGACLAIFRAMRRRIRALREGFDGLRGELAEVRAHKHHVETILAATNMCIDVCDINGNLHYVDSSLERTYGKQWQGTNCYNYFRETPNPTMEHQMRAATADRKPILLKIQRDNAVTNAVGVPFRDKGGQWLFARVHLSRNMIEAMTRVPVSQA